MTRINPIGTRILSFNDNIMSENLSFMHPTSWISVSSLSYFVFLLHGSLPPITPNGNIPLFYDEGTFRYPLRTAIALFAFIMTNTTLVCLGEAKLTAYAHMKQLAFAETARYKGINRRLQDETSAKAAAATSLISENSRLLFKLGAC